ncbi:AraC family transcriptional regulator [Microbacterium sp. ZW T5_56]|uniref:helix-turn-helix transcriptional regulator n=1 Tax=Microbacterium sp. ZW T5_56 TaxID=3378081 RepID=UPI003854409D
MTSGVLPSFGITLAAARGARTVYTLTGRRGMDSLSTDGELTSADRDGFRGRLVSVPLGESAFEDLRCSAFRFERSTGDAAGMADVARLIFVVHGGVSVQDDADEVEVGAGQWFLVPARRSFVMHSTGSSRLLSVLLPTRKLRTPRERLDALGMRPLADAAISPAFESLLRSLSQSAPNDNTVEADLTAHALLDLARALLAAQPASEPDDPDDAVRARVHDFIEHNYADPNLHVSVISAALGVSVRRLHRLFESEPLSISQCIRRWRVTAAGRELLLTDEPFETIARRVGFGSSDTGYRGFRDEYGMTPAEYRRRGRA